MRRASALLRRAAGVVLERSAAAAAILVSALVLAGCASEGEVTAPVGCKTGPEALRRALADAPGQVSLRGTPLSECLARSSDQADIQTVGVAFVEVAAELAPEARAQPDGRAALELGYLVGAARSGAKPGLHDELVRRLEQELAGVDTSSQAFRRGERAGSGSG